MNRLRLLNLFQRVLVTELAVGIARRMKVVLVGDHGEVLGLRVVLLHMLQPSVAENLRSERRLALLSRQLHGLQDNLVQRLGSVRELHCERA